MKLSLLILMAFVFLESSWAQEADSVDEIDYFEKAQDLFYTDIDSTIFYLKAGIPYYRNKKDWVTYVNCYNGLSSCHYTLGEYAKSIMYVGMARDEAQQKIGKENLAYVSSLNNLAQILTEKGQYKEALTYFKESVAINNRMGNTEYYINALGNLGKCLRKKGDLEEAILYFNSAIARHQEFDDGKDYDLAILYNSNAQAYIDKQELDTALVLLTKSIDIIIDSKTPRGKALMPMRVECYFSLADIYYKKGNTQAFFNAVAIGQQLEKNYLDQYTEAGYSLKGNWYLKNNDLPNALKAFKAALKAELEQKKSFEFHAAVGKAYLDLGITLCRQKKHQEALTNYQNALKHFSTGERNIDKMANPPLASLISDNILVELLHNKGKCLHELYLLDKVNNQHYLQAATETFELSVQVINRLRKEFLSAASKEYLSSIVLPLFEDALHCQVTLYHQNPSSENLERVFQLTEANKAAILYESISENQAKDIAGIPDSLLEQEQALRREIAFYEKNIYETKGRQDASAKKTANLEKDLFAVRTKHQQLITTFETTYPDFYRLKYQTPTPTSITEIQKNLPDEHSGLLQYFVGKNKMYALLISQQEAVVHTLERREELTLHVKQLRKLLHNSPHLNASENDFQQFSNASRSLHKTLFQPMEIPATINKLIIIPDDLLGYIPFEVLLTKNAPTEQGSYKANQLHYLIEDYQISYNYSSTLWLAGQRLTNSPENNFLGFAPDFNSNSANSSSSNNRNCSGNVLAHLNCNADEVNELSAMINGRPLVARAADKASFLAAAGQFKILHFATHSCLDDNNPMLNKIFLADDYISNYDLYNIKLESELAVLSACDTGNGPLQKGEGIMSLFRGFLHAGCPSSLISLWSVEDCTTKDIMLSYYKHLKNGSPKDEALQFAKLEYLNQADRLRSHPFYWAPFVQYGATAPLSINRGINKYWILAGLGLSFILMGLAWKFFWQKGGSHA